MWAGKSVPLHSCLNNGGKMGLYPSLNLAHACLCYLGGKECRGTLFPASWCGHGHLNSVISHTPYMYLWLIDYSPCPLCRKLCQYMAQTRKQVAIPYSWKYWWELNLAVGSQIAISNLLAGLNLWRFSTGSLYVYMRVRNFGGCWGSLPNHQI